MKYIAALLASASAIRPGSFAQEYPQPDIRGANPQNAHPDSTFSSHLHNDWTNNWTDYTNI